MSTTRENLRDALRIELRDPDGIQFEDADLNENVNRAYRLTFQQIANVLQDYFVTTDSQDIIAETSEYALPATCLRVKKVELIIGNSKVPLERYRRGAEATYTLGSSFGASSRYPTYDFEGDNLILEPTPRADVTDGLLITFYATASDLSTDGATIHAGFKDMWRDVVILRAAKTSLGQLETLGSVVSLTDLNERLKDAESTMLDSLRLRGMSPERKRRKSYFE